MNKPKNPQRHLRSPKFRKLTRNLLVIGALLIALSSAATAKEMGVGYVFYKRQKTDPDTKAEVKAVTSFEMFPYSCKGTAADGSPFELRANNVPVFLPDPTLIPDPRAAEEQLQSFLNRYPQHADLLNKLIAEGKKRAQVTASARKEATPEPKVTADVVLLDGTTLTSCAVLNASEESVKLSNDQGIRAVSYEDIDPQRSTLPEDLAKRVKAFNNPHILLKKANELLAANNEPEKNNRAITLLTRSATEDNRKAQLVLGRLYGEGKIVPYNYAEAEKWTRKAADSGLLEAQVDMALSFSPTEADALAWKEKAAKLPGGTLAIEKASAQLQSPESPTVAATDSAATERGGDSATGVRLKDPKKFVRFVDESVGDFLRAKFAGRQPPESGTKALRKSANAGDPDNQLLMFMMTSLGVGMDQNPEEGFDWLCKSAHGNNAFAQRLLGLLTGGVGECVDPDNDASRQWLEKSAAHGDVKAQELLQVLDERAKSLAPSETKSVNKSDMITDAELDSQGKSVMAMTRLAGQSAGAKFAGETGRLPTKLEFTAILTKDGVTPDKIEAGSPEEVRINRRVFYEFRTGFEEGCKQTLGIIQEWTAPAF